MITTMTRYRLTPTERVEILERSPDALVAEVRMDPGHKLPPAHRHPAQDERFDVLEGRLRIVLDGEERILGPGEGLDVPRGAAHAMAAADGGPVRARWETRPALGTEAWWTALDAELRARGGAAVPLPVLARLLRAHPGVFELALPRPVAWLALRILSLLPSAG